MSVEISVIDNTDLDDIISRLQELGSRQVKIGILSSSSGEMLTIAYVQEFGARIPVTDKMRGFFLHEFGVGLRKDTKYINIPERSYIRSGFDENENEITKNAEDLMWDALEGNISVKQFYEILGETTASLLKEHLTKVSTPKLSKLTVAKKGSTNPLIDTGRLRDTIWYEVV